jgi:hypothetical protein
MITKCNLLSLIGSQMEPHKVKQDINETIENICIRIILDNGINVKPLECEDCLAM